MMQWANVEWEPVLSKLEMYMQIRGLRHKT